MVICAIPETDPTRHPIRRLFSWSRAARWLRRSPTSSPADAPLGLSAGEIIARLNPRNRLGAVPAGPADTPHLLNAYIASAFEVALQAEALAAGAERLDLAPINLIAVVGEVARVLAPLAAAEGVRLLQDASPNAPDVQRADARRLHSVLFHLVARALAGEQPGGHVRISTACSGREVCVRILSRAPDPSLFDDAEAYRQDLTAAQRVLRAMGGALVLEPRRGGYEPLCLVLGVQPSAAALRAA